MTDPCDPRVADDATVTSPLPEPPAPRRGLVGPFSGRQLAAVLAVVIGAAIALVLVTRPIAPGPGAGTTALPVATPFLVGEAKEGLRPGDLAPELQWTGPDGSAQVLRDLDGNPVRLADLRGKLVWLNFWASWCPPCQGETPVLRDTYDAYKDRGLAIVGVAVQETTPDDVKAYANRYELGYPIAFDATADIFNKYRIFALPTQVLIGPDGVVRQVVNGPMTDDSARSLIERWLPAPSAAPPSPSVSATPAAS
jgi:thiol-disulfide isomerase/thioredoxin